jgi:DNA-binding transcriptional ArsR family regulator
MGSRSEPASTDDAGRGGYTEAAELFGYLADATRLRILIVLGKGECGVGALCERIGRPQPSVSHHLGLLRRAGMVKTRRHGKEVYYALASSPLPGQFGVQMTAGSVSVAVTLSAPPDAEAP